MHGKKGQQNKMEKNKIKWYPIVCPYCGETQHSCKSIFHEMGYYELGRGTCIKCEKGMEIIYNPTTDTLIAKKEGNS